MKKFCSLIAAAFVALLSMQASAYSVFVNVDNPDALDEIKVYADYNKTTIENIIPVTATRVEVPYSSSDPRIVITTVNGYVIRKLTTLVNGYSTEKWSGRYDTSFETSLSMYSNENEFTFETAYMQDLYTQSVTVVVTGDVSKAYMQFASTSRYVTLQQGQNTVGFLAEESTVYIGNTNSDNEIYRVSLDGEVQSKPYAWSTSWALTLNGNGHFIQIDADYPTSPCPVTFTFTDPECSGIVSGVKVNGVYKNDWTRGFVANWGDKVTVYQDSQKPYKLNDFQANGTSQNFDSYSNSYTVKIGQDDHNLDFTFDVRPWATFTGTVTVDVPERVSYRVGNSGAFNVAEETSFTIEMNEKDVENGQFTYFCPSDSEEYYFTSMTAKAAGDDEAMEISAGQGGNYSFLLSDGLEINIETAIIEHNYQAYFYMDNLAATNDIRLGLHGSLLRSARGIDVAVVDGYNELNYSQLDNPFYFQVNGDPTNVASKVWFYQNDTLVPLPDGYSYWEKDFVDQDILKVYVGETAPATYSMTLKLDKALAEIPEVTVDYLRAFDLDAANVATTEDNFDVYNALTVLPGTRVIIKGEGLLVVAGEDTVSADGDGNYVVDVTADTVISVSVLDPYDVNAAYFYVDSSVPFPGTSYLNINGFNFSGGTLAYGYNEITPGESTYDLMMYAGSDNVSSYVWFYKNDERIYNGTQNTFQELTFAKHDVYKLYVAESAPERCDVTFKYNPVLETEPVVMIDYVNKFDKEGANVEASVSGSFECYATDVLPGTRVVVSGGKMTVLVDGAEVEADAEGNYVIDVTAATVVTFDTPAPEAPDAAYIYVDSTVPFPGTSYLNINGFNFSGGTLAYGYNEITPGESTYDLMMYAGSDNVSSYVWFYKNDKRIDNGTQNTFQELTFANHDVYKLYVAETAPERYDLTFQYEEGLEARPTIFLDYVVTFKKNGANVEATSADGYDNYTTTVLPGTHVIINGSNMSVFVDGNAVEADGNGNYVFDVTASTIVTFNGPAPETPNVAYFYVDSTVPFPGNNYLNINGFQFSYGSLAYGYNELEPSAESYQLMMYAGPTDVTNNVWFYKNDERIDNGTQNTFQDLTIAKHDIYKLYVCAEEPEWMLLQFMFDKSLAKQPEVILDFVKPANLIEMAPVGVLDGEGQSIDYDTYGQEVLPGTNVIVKPNGATMSLSVNGKELAADGEGNYSFAATDHLAVEVRKSSGVDSLTVDAAADTRIFNLQGIEMTGRQLPAGLYIQNGRKFVVK